MYAMMVRYVYGDEGTARIETAGRKPTMTTETITVAEMTTDAKRVYKSGGSILIALADKYGATSKGLGYARRNPDSMTSEVVHATGSKSATAELQRNTYAAIKGRIADAGK